MKLTPRAIFEQILCRPSLTEEDRERSWQTFCGVCSVVAESKGGPTLIRITPDGAAEFVSGSYGDDMFFQMITNKHTFELDRICDDHFFLKEPLTHSLPDDVVYLSSYRGGVKIFGREVTLHDALKAGESRFRYFVDYKGDFE